MPIISFWSKRKKETAQTLSLVAIATQMAVEHNFRILIVDTCLDDPTITNCYWNKKNVTAVRTAVQQLNKGKMDIGGGLSGLAQIIASGKETKEIVKDYTKVIYPNRLEILTGGKMAEGPRLEASFKNMINVASRYYDYVFVDLQKGLDKPFIKDILDLSKVIVVNLTQKMVDFEEYQDLLQSNPIFKSTKVLPLIGRYDRYSKYTKKNVTRNLLKLKDEVSAVNYNTLFFEAASEGEMREYFLKFRESLIKSIDRNAAFIESVKNAKEDIMNRIKAVEMGF